jgi:hypothetical protein
MPFKLSRGSRLVGAVVAALLLVAVSSIAINASADPPEGLRGSWSLSLDSPIGQVPVTVTFRNGGDGVANFGGNTLPLSYRETGTNFSTTWEVPAANSPFGQPLTLLIRGARTSDSTLSGTARFITDIPDPAPGSFGFVAPSGSVTGTKN